MEETTTTARRSGTSRARRRRGPNRSLWWFLLPAVVPYAFVVLVPSAQGAAFAFTDWDGLNPDFSFVWFDNFVAIASDDQAIRAITNTVALAVVATILENVIGLALALGLHAKVKSRHLLRVLFFAPVVIITIVIAVLWQFLYTPNGPVNELLAAVGLGDLQQNWLGDPSIALWSICAIVVWQFSGYAMVIYIAGLQGVPEEQIEAAALDGANAWQRFWHVVRPFLAPAITVNLMLSLIRGLMIFDQIWVTTQGGPASSTNSLSTLVYRNAFQYSEYGYSIALAVVLTLFVAILGIVQYRLLLRGGRR